MLLRLLIYQKMVLQIKIFCIAFIIQINSIKHETKIEIIQMIIKQKRTHLKSKQILIPRVNKRPNFTYIKPKSILDDQFPQQTIYSLEHGCNEQSQDYQMQQQTFNDVCKIQQVSWIKFDKATFIKIKQKNFTKFYKTIISCIGKGAFGTVAKVQSLVSHQYRAAKTLQKKNMATEDMEKLMTQVYIMMELDHNNIANLLEVYQYKNQFTLICELCEGGDLQNFTKQPKRSNIEQTVGKIIKQLLRAVIYLHSKGIIHRDIKPQNILFQTQNSNRIKLIDFGIAAKIQKSHNIYSRVGTPAFIAPQIILQKYNQKVDVWAIGITMYNILSGHIPFHGNNLKQLMTAILKNQIDFKQLCWQNITQQCIQVIRLMTIKNPAKRPTAKQIFQHQYFQKIQDNQVTNQEKQDFIDSFRNFQFKNKLQAAINTFIVSQLLSIQQKNELVNFFQQFDSDNDGVISKQEMRQVLSKRKKISVERIQTLMQIMDTNGSGMIDYTQFLAAGFVDVKEFTIQRLKQAFAHFDTNSNGRISLQQVKYFMRQLSTSDKQVILLFEQFDKDKDGSISQDQFIDLMLDRSKNMVVGTGLKTVNQMEMRMETKHFDSIIQQMLPDKTVSIYDSLVNSLHLKGQSTQTNIQAMHSPQERKHFVT